MVKKPVLAILCPNDVQVTETFIKAHTELIDADIKILFGGYLPNFVRNEGPLVAQHIVARIARKIEQTLLPEGVLSSHERAIIRYLKKEKVEVVLAEFGLTGVRAYQLCRAAGIPLIVHFHGFDAHMYRTIQQYGAAYKKMFDYASYIVGVSRYMCNALEQLGAPTRKIVYNPYGPNPVFFNCQPASDAKILVALGRFIPKKAPFITIKAFARIASEFPDIRLRMGGTGELWDSCKQLVKDLQLEDRIDLPGIVTNDQVPPLFNDALAFVQHSVIAPDGDTEGTPVAVIEASAAGLPVIATKHAGIPDVIVNGETGFLVKEHDIDGFAEAMRTILKSPEMAIKMGEKGKSYIKANFSMEKHINTLNNLIRQLSQ